MPTTTSSRTGGSFAGTLDRFFHIKERGSTVGQEIRGGLVTFFAMSYIIVLNPIILSAVPSDSGQFLGGGDTPAFASAVATTALVAGVMTIVMGLVANFPLALAAGLGINSVVVYSIATIKGSGMTYADAMGLIVLEGVIILVLVLTGFRQAVFKAVPSQLKTAIGVGIGLFIALIGVVDSGFVTSSNTPPLTFGTAGSLSTWPVVVFTFGLILAIILMVRKVKGAILISIVSATVVAIVVEAVAHLGPKVFDESGNVTNPGAWSLNVPALPKAIVSVPDFSLIGQFDLFGAVGKIGIVSVVLLVFSLLLADFFDTMGTMVAIGAEAGLLDEQGNPPRTTQILVVDSVAAIAGGAAGISSNTSYVESAAGVGDGARTGLSAVVTGVCFLLATFLAPLAEMIPYEAATPALVVVGFLMMMGVTGIDWKDYEISIPAFLTVILMPFTYSITVGIGAGFVSFVLIKIFVGKARQIHPLMWVAAVLFVFYFARSPIQAWLGVG